jgi:hypothetical protein
MPHLIRGPVLVAGVILLLAACGSTAPSSPATHTPASATPAALVAGELVGDAGHLAGIALSTSGRQVIAYICDGNARYLTLAQWFTGPVLGLLSGPGARGLQANAEGSWGGPISVALAQIYDPANNPAQPGVTLNDQVDALVGLLRGLRDQLVIAMRDEPAQAGLGEALQAFLDVSHTIGMSAVTTLENAIRDQTGNADPFSVTFNELFLRDRVSLLHDLAGDVPRELFLSDQDAPFDYLRTATAHLVLGIDVPGRGRMDAPDVMRELVQDLDMAKRLLDGNPTVDEFIAAVERRDSAILHLAVVAQTLGSETTRLVTCGKLAAASARTRLARQPWPWPGCCPRACAACSACPSAARPGSPPQTWTTCCRTPGSGPDQLRVDEDAREKKDPLAPGRYRHER